MSRPYRVWIESLAGQDGETITISSTGMHNTFPCPDFTDEQLEAIEHATDRVMMTMRYAMTESVIELYERDELPDELQRAHDHLDSVVCEALGIDVIASDDAIAAQLTQMYQSFLGV